MKIKLSILTLLLFCSSFAFAQIKFTASADRTTIGTGEIFEITFSINANGERFAPPAFAGFQVVAGPNVSNSVSMINGVTSASLAYGYDLMATKEGEFTIGPATIMAGGRPYSTAPIKIKVVKGSAPGGGGGSQGNSRQQQQQQFNAPDESNIQRGRVKDISKSLFLRTSVDKSSVYLGQQIVMNLRLYTRVAIVNGEPEKIPDLNSFYSQDIKNNNPNAQWRTEVLNGVRYNVTDIKKTILFPEHEGNITIEPAIMNFVIRQQAASSSGDPFDAFFGGYEDVKYRIKSTPVVIHVKPLPMAGKPADFSGAVGTFNIAASLDKNQIKANDAINYQLKVSGTGNLKLLKPISPNFPPDFEKYDPKVTDTITENENGSSGSRRYTYLLIPRHQGDYTIDPVKFSYFNPATGRYVTLTTRAFQVKVAKGTGDNSNVTAFSGAGKQDVKVLSNDIRYIKTGTELNEVGSDFYGSGLYYFLLVLGPLGFAGALVYGKWRDKNNADVAGMKSRKAGRVAAKHLAVAKQRLAANDSKAFYEDLFRGLYGYLSNKLNIPYADLNREKIADELKARSLDESLINEMLDTLDMCEMARYAPVSGITGQQVFDKAQTMINNIESKI
ncbi:oxygen tolerance protein BatD [Mucilaginibacter oryzae]|uniref:Oxygen tolerance protein BatD n=1 Tax=Mucilaginibacter oryzae TaxID=468058 RepID=A0A316H685_9SPHI|nr:BatD family protein [Mucilaginibacter oryzae]PWK75976.1 oxygen tolerance protein BatD [Mucilaginibacter oryzae]